MKQNTLENTSNTKKEEKVVITSNTLIPKPAINEIQNVKMQKIVRNYLNNYVDFNYLN